MFMSQKQLVVWCSCQQVNESEARTCAIKKICTKRTQSQITKLLVLYSLSLTHSLTHTHTHTHTHKHIYIYILYYILRIQDERKFPVPLRKKSVVSYWTWTSAIRKTRQVEHAQRFSKRTIWFTCPTRVTSQIYGLCDFHPNPISYFRQLHVDF